MQSVALILDSFFKCIYLDIEEDVGQKKVSPDSYNKSEPGLTGFLKQLPSGVRLVIFNIIVIMAI